MTGHTKLPWAYEPASGGLSDPHVGISEGAMPSALIGPDGEIICQANYDDCQSDEDVERREHDMQLMATACNAHDQLVTALEQIATSDDDGSQEDLAPSMWTWCRLRARQALAAAGEKKE